jgi:hypothetical protein
VGRGYRISVSMPGSGLCRVAMCLKEFSVDPANAMAVDPA